MVLGGRAQREAKRAEQADDHFRWSAYSARFAVRWARLCRHGKGISTPRGYKRSNKKREWGRPLGAQASRLHWGKGRPAPFEPLAHSKLQATLIV